MLVACPANEVFLDDTPEAESLPRGKVLEFLVSMKRDLGIRYLEHIINDLNELSPMFHDRLVSLYLDEASESTSAAGHRAEIREKMVKFLEVSEQYMPERALGRLSRSTSSRECSNIDDEFLPEKAVVLSKMGQHKNALEIYVFKLQDYAKAETYSPDRHD
jgi:Vam6/Vps39-like protein vacuolar protein sorting-associated protein 39